MIKSISKDKIVGNIETLEQIRVRMDETDKKQQINHDELINELNRFADYEKSVIIQIANSINKMSEKINALANELEEKNKELNAYRDGFNFRIDKATFSELAKLYQFLKHDQNPNYIGIIEEIFDINGISRIESYKGMKFDPKKHIVRGLQMTTNDKEDDTIYTIVSEGYFVSDHHQNKKVLKYTEVIINKMEDK